MNSLNTNWGLILSLSFLSALVLVFGIFIIIYVILKNKWTNSSQNKERISNRYSKNDQIPFYEESSYSEVEDFISITRKNSSLEKNTDMDCVIEYRTRGSQLIVVISQVFPSVLSYYHINNSKDIKIYFIVYLNGDYTNTPCESTKKLMAKQIDVNEIFIFTVMPYDLPSLELIVLSILLINDKKFIMGTLNLPLYELDQQLYPIEKTYSIPFPEERLILPDCLLCLSITNSKTLIKIKIIRLHIFDCSFPDDQITGLSLKLFLESPDKPDQVLCSTKKKYKSTLTFNETMIFETLDIDKMNINLKIQLLESSRSNGNEVVIVRGNLEMKSRILEENKYNKKWMEALDNLDSEVICWYSISYEK